MTTTDTLQTEIDTLGRDLEVLAAQLNGRDDVLTAQFEAVQVQMAAIRDTVNSISTNNGLLQERLDQQVAALSSSVHDMIDTTLAQSDQVLQSFTHTSSIGIGMVAVLLAVVSSVGWALVQWNKRNAYKEMTQTLTDKLLHDDEFSTYFFDQLVGHENLKAKVELMTKSLVNTRMREQNQFKIGDRVMSKGGVKEPDGHE